MDKTIYRSSAIARRKALSATELEELSEQIAQRFPLDLLKCHDLIHVFYPIPGKQEVDTLRLIERIRFADASIRFVLSKSNLDTCTLRHILWTDTTPLAMNRWGITEPLEGLEVDPATLSIVIVPLLAFDVHGNRLGYGKGFYDRFLSECPDALKIGLCYFDAEEAIPADAHDIPLDLCVSPSKVYDFRRPSTSARQT